MIESAIERELQTVTGILPVDGEDRDKYLRSMIRVAANEIDDAAWDTLSEAAQTWANDCVSAIQEKVKVLPEPPDAVVTDDDPIAAPDTDDDAETAVAGNDVDGNVATPPDDPPEEPAATAKGRNKNNAPARSKRVARKERKKKAEKAAADVTKTVHKNKRGPKTAKAIGGVRRMKTIMLSNPGWERDAVEKQLVEEGYALAEATIKTFYFDMKGTMVVMRELGMLPDEAPAD